MGREGGERDERDESKTDFFLPFPLPSSPPSSHRTTEKASSSPVNLRRCVSRSSRLSSLVSRRFVASFRSLSRRVELTLLVPFLWNEQRRAAITDEQVRSYMNKDRKIDPLPGKKAIVA